MDFQARVLFLCGTATTLVFKDRIIPGKEMIYYDKCKHR